MGSARNDDGESSSSEEDGDEQWKAAINAVASTTTFLGCPPPSKSTSTTLSDEDLEDAKPLQQQSLKHYQIKAQKALDDMLEKSLVMVRDPDPFPISENNPEMDEVGVRLFKRAPRGIVFDHRDEPKGPRKKPRILPGQEIDERSKKFKKRVQSVVVEGMNILASAKDACQKSLLKWETKQAAARDAAKREEERVAMLKKERGEQWLPSLAKEMQAKQVR